MAEDSIGAIGGIKGRGSLEGTWGTAAGVQAPQQPGRQVAGTSSQETAQGLDGVQLSDELHEESQVAPSEQDAAGSRHIHALLGHSSGADSANREPGLQRGGVMTPEGWSGQEPGLAQGFVAVSGRQES